MMMARKPWVQVMSRLAARREWVLELLGERRSTAILRRLAASPDPEDKRLALSQLDRLPEWLDLLTAWLGQQPEENLVLEALDDVSRLTGPYAQLAFRTYLSQRLQGALCGDSPADCVWALSLQVARWSRGWSSLSRLRLVLADPRSVLSRVPESLRGFSRWVETAGQVERDLARLVAAWPDSAGAARLPLDEPALWRPSRLSVARTHGASLPPTVATDPSGTKLPRAA
jgi:hypothetical protein